MKRQLLASALTAVLAAGSAHAVTLDSSSGAAAVTSYSSGSQLSFDLDFTTSGSATLNFSIEASDVGTRLSFNSLVRNLSGLGFDGATLSIQGAVFSAPGSIATDGFQAISATGHSATQAWARFTPALTTDFYFGAPLGTGTDWTISLAGAQAGDKFSLTVAVPEPETYALMAVGLAVLGVAPRRRRGA